MALLQKPDGSGRVLSETQLQDCCSMPLQLSKEDKPPDSARQSPMTVVEDLLLKVASRPRRAMAPTGPLVVHQMRTAGHILRTAVVRAVGSTTWPSGQRPGNELLLAVGVAVYAVEGVREIQLHERLLRQVWVAANPRPHGVHSLVPPALGAHASLGWREPS